MRVPFTNAQFAFWAARLARLAAIAQAELAEGMWNPNFCSASSVAKASSIRADLTAMMDTLDQRIKAAEKP